MREIIIDGIIRNEDFAYENYVKFMEEEGAKLEGEPYDDDQSAYLRHSFNGAVVTYHTIKSHKPHLLRLEVIAKEGIFDKVKKYFLKRYKGDGEESE